MRPPFWNSDFIFRHPFINYVFEKAALFTTNYNKLSGEPFSILLYNCLYFGRYFTFFKTSIFHNEAYYILRHNAGISANYVKAKKLFRYFIYFAEKAALYLRAPLVL